MAGLYVPPRPSLVTWVTGGIYGPAPTTGNSTRSMTAAQNWYMAILVPHSVNISKIGTEVTVQGTTAVLRYGIYTDKNGFPDQLIAGSDAGAISVTGTGLFESTLTGVNIGPGLYWICVDSPTAAAACTLKATNAQTTSEFVRGIGNGTAITQGNTAGYNTAGGSGDAGALSQTAKTPTGISSNAPVPYVIIG